MRNSEYQSSRMGSGLTAFLIGGLIGGTIALLYAPRSGKETREYLMNEGQETAERVRQTIRDSQEKIMAAIEDAQVRLEALNEETRDRLQRLQVIAQETIDDEKQVFDKRYGQVKEVMKD